MFDSCSSGSFRHKTPTAGTTTPKSPFFGKIKKRVPEFSWKNSDRGFRKKCVQFGHMERGKNETVYSKSGRGVVGYDRKKY